LLIRGDRPLSLGFERLVLATGARELFLPFPGWTLPGVVGAGGAQALLKAGARFEGRRVVVAGTGPLLLAVAAALRRAGARIAGIAEQAPLPRSPLRLLAAPGRWPRPGYAAALAGVPY
jgi:NADPH-dependent 2,4-dienoyl-CoA reductase/sulfur reductase-like enzyme